jgi:hypothetical protein
MRHTTTIGGLLGWLALGCGGLQADPISSDGPASVDADAEPGLLDPVPTRTTATLRSEASSADVENTAFTFRERILDHPVPLADLTDSCRQAARRDGMGERDLLQDWIRYLDQEHNNRWADFRCEVCAGARLLREGEVTPWFQELVAQGNVSNGGCENSRAAVATCTFSWTPDHGDHEEPDSLVLVLPLDTDARVLPEACWHWDKPY